MLGVANDVEGMSTDMEGVATDKEPKLGLSDVPQHSQLPPSPSSKQR